MRTKLGSCLLTAALAATLASCGGSAAGTPSGTTAAGPTGAAAPTDEAATTTGATPTAASGGTLDVCGMLAPADVQAITGKAVTAGPQEGADLPDWAAGQCWWNSDDMGVRFSVDVGTKASIAASTSPTAAEQLEMSRLAYGAFGKVEDVALGDGAIWAGGFVVAIKGDAMMQLYAMNMDKAKAVEIARLVVDKL